MTTFARAIRRVELSVSLKEPIFEERCLQPASDATMMNNNGTQIVVLNKSRSHYRRGAERHAGRQAGRPAESVN